MSRICKWLTGAFVLLYLAALALFAIGTFGLFGSERGPLVGVFLVPLGLPWVRFADAFPESLHPWLAACAPLVNVLLLLLACRAFGSADSRRRNQG